MSKKYPTSSGPASQPKAAPHTGPTPAADDPPVEPGVAAGEQPVREGTEPLPDAGESLPDGTEPGEATGEGERQPGELDRIRAELEEAKDRELRSRAELENFRKRAARQMEEQLRYANMPLIRDLLPVWDSMGRAIEAAEKTHQTSSLLEGIKMVAGQLEGVLQRHHCSRIDALHQPFDPNLHEAIFQQPSGEHPANTVLVVTQVGFQLHGRVVRPSQVVVSAGDARPEEGPGGGAGEEQEADRKKDP